MLRQYNSNIHHNARFWVRLYPRLPSHAQFPQASRQFRLATVSRTRLSGSASAQVRNTQKPPEINNSIKMEVGIEDCLHIEFEYAKSKYHLKARPSSLFRTTLRARGHCSYTRVSAAPPGTRPVSGRFGA